MNVHQELENYVLCAKFHLCFVNRLLFVHSHAICLPLLVYYCLLLLSPTTAEQLKQTALLEKPKIFSI